MSVNDLCRRRHSSRCYDTTQLFPCLLDPRKRSFNGLSYTFCVRDIDLEEFRSLRSKLFDYFFSTIYVQVENRNIAAGLYNSLCGSPAESGRPVTFND